MIVRSVDAPLSKSGRDGGGGGSVSMKVAHRRRDNCKVCGRPSDEEFCRYHAEAFKRVNEHFEVWKERKGVAWEDYLREVAKNENTGKWVREVVEYLLRGSR